MKKISVFLIMLVFVANLYGCGKILDTDIQQEITENEIISVTEPEGNKIRINDSDRTLEFEISGDKVYLSGNYDYLSEDYAMLVIEGDETRKDPFEIAGGVWNGNINLPENRSECVLNLFVGKEKYGNYRSLIIDFIKLKKNGDVWQFVSSPVLENNIDIFNYEKENGEYIESTSKIQSDDPEISELAESITRTCRNDYEKAKAIHDWVAENIYYDYDALATGDYSDLDARNVLESKKAVCEGYANLFAALARSQNIPCKIQSGYALGLGEVPEWTASNVNTNETNHAWNEVFVDGRWIIVDATWDSMNEFRAGEYKKGDNINSIYFDSNMEFFSMSHKIIEEG